MTLKLTYEDSQIAWNWNFDQGYIHQMTFPSDFCILYNVRSFFIQSSKIKFPTKTLIVRSFLPCPSYEIT